MLGKPVLIERARKAAQAAQGRADEAAAIVMDRIGPYERNDQLGGPECLKLQQALVGLRDALGGDQEADQLQREALEAYYF